MKKLVKFKSEATLDLCRMQQINKIIQAARWGHRGHHVLQLGLGIGAMTGVLHRTPDEVVQQILPVPLYSLYQKHTAIVHPLAHAAEQYLDIPEPIAHTGADLALEGLVALSAVACYRGVKRAGSNVRKYFATSLRQYSE